jgi:NAD(P)-dependent dehydrogenase (short-subunit alcohol dehydrogenase family)
MTSGEIGAPQPALPELSDRVAVVTGGASGIGQGIARRLVEEGMRVIISDIERDALAQTADELGATAIAADVSDSEQIQALADAAVQQHGTVHLLVNNAGVGSMGRIADLTLQDWRWMIDVNLFGVIHGIHSFLPILAENADGGFLVNTASMAGLTTTPGVAMGAYTAAKMGVVGVTEILIKELAESGTPVGASVLCPGPVHSRINESLRVRPSGETGGLFDVDAATEGPLSTMRWMEPSEVGALVVGAIRRGDPYIITHPELWSVVAERYQSVAAAFGRTLHT